MGRVKSEIAWAEIEQRKYAEAEGWDCERDEPPPLVASLRMLSLSEHNARLRGHLASIVADPDCCAASKTIARQALETLAPTTQGTDSGLAVFDEDELLDEISEAISDSFDVDWTARDGARHVVGLLAHKGLIALAER